MKPIDTWPWPVATSITPRKAYHFNRLEELLLGLEEAMSQPGPIFILVSVYPDDAPAPAPAYPARRMAESWPQLRQHLAGG